MNFIFCHFVKFFFHNNLNEKKKTKYMISKKSQ